MVKSKPKPSTSATLTPDMILAIDLGGTKCEMAVYRPGNDSFSGFARYACRDFHGIEAVLRRYQEEHNRTPNDLLGNLPKRLAVAVAGLVDGDQAQMTNLDWRLEGKKMRQAFGLDEVLLVNDLTAVCAAVPCLGADDLLVLQKGERRMAAPVAVLAPGTGLGEGMLITGGGCQHALGGEGGHCDFAPVNDEQIELLRFMRKRHQSVSYEMLAAGPAMIHLFEFCQENSGLAARPEVASRLAMASDKTPVIIDAALAADFCPLCRKTLELFLEILGAEAGNLALKIYARGGLYLAGGILPRLVGKISFAPFLAAFNNKKMMASLLAAIPVFLVRHPHPALLGAVRLACSNQKTDG